MAQIKCLVLSRKNHKLNHKILYKYLRSLPTIIRLKLTEIKKNKPYNFLVKFKILVIKMKINNLIQSNI